MIANRYPGNCHACRRPVEPGKGIWESGRPSRGTRPRGRLWCRTCFNISDHSGPEDRQCGDRAYEDACARACGL